MNGLMSAIAAQQMGGGPQMQLATPINDVQLIALIAASLSSELLSAREAVEKATDIVVEAILQQSRLGEKLQIRKSLNGSR